MSTLDAGGRFARNVLFLIVAMACAGRLAAQPGSLEVLQSFSGPPNGSHPTQPLILGGDGNFYGTTTLGGHHNRGTIFKVAQDGTFTTLYTFTGGADGAGPEAGLTQGADGNFYGTTFGGGDTKGDGTVFKITPDGVFTTLSTFTGGAGGAGPGARLALGNDGNFYSTTQGGGDSNGDGTFFRVTPAGVLTILYTFTGGADGANPIAGLSQGRDGNFYSTTPGSPPSSNGTVFEITPDGVLATLYTFTGGADGSSPQAGITQGSDGNFYGTTSFGGNTAGNGTIFQITPAGVLTTLHVFTGGAGGSSPEAGLTPGSDGNFYGTTAGGGQTKNDGTVFRITPAGVFAPLCKFSGKDGAGPQAGLTVGGDGNFYGTAPGGGKFGMGVIFRLTLGPAPQAVSLAATVPQVVLGSGDAGMFTLSLPAPQSVDVVVAYKIKGSAINGMDYQLIKASNIKAGETSKDINIVPQGDLGGASQKVVTLVLSPGDGYSIGTTGKVKVKILSAP